MSEPSPSVAPHRAALAFIFVTILLDILAMGIIIPVLPKLLVNMMQGDSRRAAELFGVFGTAYALMQMCFSPMTGALSDRLGRRPVILLSNLGLGLDYILMALAPTVGWLFAGRIISGITSASISTASAYLADVTPEHKRASSYSLVGMAFGIGFVMGPALGGLLGGINPRLPFWVAAGLSLANALYGLFVLPESLPPERRTKVLQWKSANPLGALRLVLARPGLRGFTCVHFLYDLAHTALPSVFVLYASYRHGWSESTVGFALTLTGLVTVLVQGVLLPRSISLVGERRTLMMGLAFGAAGFGIYALAWNEALFWIGIPVTALWGFYEPTASSQFARHASDSERGQVTGAVASLMGTAGMIGPVLFTQLFAFGIAPEHGVNLPGTPFLFGMMLLATAVLLAPRVTMPDPEAPPEPTPAPASPAA